MKIFKEIKVLPTSPFSNYVVHSTTYGYRICPPEFDIDNPQSEYNYNVKVYSHKDKGQPRPISCNTDIRWGYSNTFKYDYKRNIFIIEESAEGGLIIDVNKVSEIFYKLYGKYADINRNPLYRIESIYIQYPDIRPYFITRNVKAQFVLDVWDTIYNVCGGEVSIEFKSSLVVTRLDRVNKSIFDYLEIAVNENI